MNAIEDNPFTRAWRDIGDGLRPRAIVAFSAHWYGPGTRVTAMERPPTIHDFGGFPRELFAYEYPAPGDPALAQRIAALLAPAPVALDTDWGLDHGTWSVLAHAFPRADIPVVQVSLDAAAPHAFFVDLGARLAPLRDEGVLLMATGNVVHNLRAFVSGRGGDERSERFEQRVRTLAAAGDVDALANYDALGEDARFAIPTPEHYLPLLPIVGSRHGDEPVTFPTAGTPGAGISMLSVRVG